MGDDTLHSTCVLIATHGQKGPNIEDNGTWDPICTLIKIITRVTPQDYLQSRKDDTALHLVMRKVLTALRETHIEKNVYFTVTRQILQHLLIL